MKNKRVFAIAAIGIVAVGCGISKKQANLLEKSPEGFNISALNDVNRAVDSAEFHHQKVDRPIVPEDYEALMPDTLETGELIMKNVKDEETGEEILVDRIRPSLIVARFAQRQERGGKVPIDFEVRVPEYMIDDNWQVRLYPDLLLMNSHAAEHIREVLDSTRLNMMVLDGQDYRNRQLRGYERYERYISSIVSDSTQFVKRNLLETFLERNIPNVYKFKKDSTLVSEEAFVSAFGVDDIEVIEHYTRDWQVNRNAARIENKDKVFARMVRTPRVDGGIKLDTVLRSGSGEFIYKYSTEITTKGKPSLNKALVYLSGDIYNGPEHLYTIPRTDSLEFPISSVVEFVKDTTMYKVIYVPTHLADNSEFNINFAVGKANVDQSRGDNAAQIRAIRSKIRELLNNEKYTLDSIMVTATASPEGAWNKNRELSDKRSRSVSDIFVPFANQYRDSIIRAIRDSLDGTMNITLDYAENGRLKEVGTTREDPTARVPRIKFQTQSLPEYWDKLTELVDADEQMTGDQKAAYHKRLAVANPDSREAQMKNDSYYRYIKENLYPQLRVVRFDFMLHRKETVQARIVTDEIDDVYMAALDAIKNRDWETGIDILRYDYPDDYNLGVAYLMMDRNESARAILEAQPKTSDVYYMLALAYFRLGREQDALEAFKQSCRLDRQKYWRGGKDGEINYLINLYGLTYNSVVEGAEE